MAVHSPDSGPFPKLPFRRCATASRNSTPAERIIRSMVASVAVPSSLWWRSSRVALRKPHATAMASKNEDFPALFSPTRKVAPDSRGIRTSTIFLKFDT